MKIIKNFFRTIMAIFHAIYKVIDKIIVVPVTKLILIINDKLGNRTDRFEKWITRKNTLIFISLVLAVLLFFYVDDKSMTIINDNAEVLYGQKVDIIYNNKSYVVEGLPESVDVTLIGRQVDLYLAKQLSGGAVTADLTGLTEGMHTIKLDYDCAIDSVEYKMDPSIVNVTIYPRVSQTRTATIDVINENSLDSKLSISNVELDNSEIVIKGAEHVLSKVSSVKALVDIKKITDPEVGVMVLDKEVKLIAYDSDGEVIKDVETEPSKISAKVTIVSPDKKVPIEIIPVGKLEFGKAIDSITTPDITEVTIYGDKDVLADIESVPVEVDVTGLSENKTYNVIINKPSGVKEISATSVKVKIAVDKEVTKEIQDVTIDPINYDKTKYKVFSQGVNSSITTVVVKGTQSVVDKIDASKITAQVDLTGYKPSDKFQEANVIVFGDDKKASYTSKTTKVSIRLTEK